MALTPPTSLSPSKVASFTDCGLAFRFSAIDRLPEPPSVAASRGTLVHAALERLFGLDPHLRTPDAAKACLAEAAEAFTTDPDYVGLQLTEDQAERFVAEAGVLVEKYFRLEDPTTINPIGLELKLETEVGGTRLRGIIDRLELDENGELVVTDYKTGKPPTERNEQARMAGVHFYSLLCERNFGRRPSRVQLLYLSKPVAISTRSDDFSMRASERRLAAIWAAVERACERDDFRHRQSALCNWCAFQQYCPAFGGDPAEGARVGLRLREERTMARLDHELALPR